MIKTHLAKYLIFHCINGSSVRKYPYQHLTEFIPFFALPWSCCSIPSLPPSFNVVEYVQISKVEPNSSLRPCLITHITLNRPLLHYAPVSKHKEMRTKLRWTISYKSLYLSTQTLSGCLCLQECGKGQL